MKPQKQHTAGPSGWGPLARILRRAVRRLFGCWRLDSPAGPSMPDGPCVYVVHHQNLAGPLTALALLPGEPRPWVLHPFCGRQTCFAQYYRYTFTVRFGWPRLLALPAAGLGALLVPPLLRSLGSIPVYRAPQSGGGLRRTWQLSRQVLERGESLVICPDIDYANPSADTGALYRGFLALGRDFQRRQGRPLPFVPAVCDRAGRRLLLGQPVFLEPGQPPARQKVQAAALLALRLNELAASARQADVGTTGQKPVFPLPEKPDAAPHGAA